MNAFEKYYALRKLYGPGSKIEVKPPFLTKKQVKILVKNGYIDIIEGVTNLRYWDKYRGLPIKILLKR